MSSHRYGNIHEVDAKGASRDGGQTFSVSDSKIMAADDLPYIKRYKDKIIGAANKYQVQSSVVAAIISRETRGGRGAGLSADGWGDNRNAFGLMQVDKRWHTPRGGWDSQEHIEQGTKILVDCYSDVERKYNNWTKNQKLKGALAAYNMGAERMGSYDRVDAHTTGGDYSNDVAARAQYYGQHGFS